MKRLFHLLRQTSIIFACAIIYISATINPVKAQLAVGDIAVIGWNSDPASTTKDFAVVTLANIASGETIFFTDKGISNGDWQADLGTEGIFSLVTTTSITAGTVIRFSVTSGTTPGVTSSPSVGTLTVTNGWTSISTASPFGNNGDQIIIYQGSLASPTFIFAFTSSINTIGLTNGWNSGGSGANNYSEIPPGLTNGTNAVSHAGALALDNYAYAGTTSGTKAALLTAICNPGNWNGDDINPYDFNPGGTQFPGTNPIFTISSGNSAPTDISLSATAINENVAVNATVGTFSTTDPNPGDTFTYTLVSGTGSTDNASFNISGNNLRITNSPDYETKNSYSIRVRSTDQGSLHFEKQFTITINDVNEAPTDINLSATSINENVAANSTIGSFTTTDPDAGNTFTYTLVSGTGDTDNASFNISGSNLRITNSPNYEAKNSYAIRVRTTDQGGLHFEKQFTITINDINEAPTDISLSATSIDENVPANSTVGTFSTTDPDAGNTFTYTLVSGTGDTDNASFNISGSNLRITNSPDYETKNSYSIRVRTTDQGGLHFEKQFTITINDLPEADPPTVTTSAPASVSTISATLGGNVTDDGGATVTERGIVYSTNANPTTADNKVQIGSGTGSFSQSVPGLSPGTLYYVRAYAINSGGTAYGSQQSFTTLVGVASIVRHTPSSALTNSNTVVFQVNLTGPVSGLSSFNFSVTTTGISGPSWGGITGSGSTYYVTYNTGTGNGTLRLNLGNTIGVTPSITGLPYFAGEIYTFDRTPPTVAVTSTLTGPTNTSPIPVNINFSESVTGFVVGDIAVSGGTLSNFSGSGANYTVDVTPSGDGTVTVNVAAGVAQDAAGNGNTAATQFSISYDGTAPTVAITSTLSNPTNTSPIPVNINFSEDVTGFVVGDIVVTGGTLSNFSGSGMDYTVDVTPSGDGTVTVNVAAGVAQDAAGNLNTAATQFSIVSDRTVPTVAITSDETSPTNANPIPVKIDFSESVIGFVIGDISVSGGTLSNFSGSGANYTVDVMPSGDGTITVNIAAGVAQDAAGNGNTAATQFSIVSDRTAPTVAVTSSLSNPTNTSPIPVKIDFSESVTGFVVGDISVSGGILSNFSGSGANYTVDVTPSGDGTVTVNVAAGVALDAAGNGNTAATQFSIIYNGTPPTVAITSTVTGPTNTSPIPVNINFSEDVTGFVVGDIIVSGGTLSNFSGSGASYTMDVTPSSDGTITINVAAGVAQDAAGNLNTAATQFSIVSDRTVPTVAITSDETSPTNANPIPVKIDFSESVIGFVIGDISVSGGSLSNFSGSGANYTVDVTPSSDGTITINIAAGVAQDAAGNLNTAAAQFSIVSDRTVPTVAVTSSFNNPTNTSPPPPPPPIPVTIDFSEDVTGFVVSDIAVTGGTLSNFSGSGASYTVDVTPSGDGTVTVNVAAGVAHDAAGNGNTAATQFSIAYDGTAPTVAITSVVAGPTHTSPIPVNIDFSKGVTSFVVGDIIVSGGTLSNFSGSGANYTVDVTPSGDGTVTVDIAAGVAQDVAGNDNTAATQFSIVYDATKPVVLLSTQANNPTNVVFEVTFTFSEPVSGFDLADIVVANGTASGFASISPSVYTAAITPAAQGAVTVSVPAGIAEDAAANLNVASLVLEMEFDNIAPAGYVVQFNESMIDADNVQSASINVTGAEAGTAYFYAIASATGGSPVTGTAIAPSANFTISGINLSSLGDGTATLIFYQQDAAGNKGPEVTDAVEKFTKDIVAITPPAAIQVPVRTPYADVPLPATVEAIYSSGEKELIPVAWHEGGYNGDVAGLYELAGTITLSPGTTNLNDVKAKVTIAVLENLPPDAILLSNNIFQPNIAPEEAIGFFSTADPDDDTHVYALASGSGDADNALFQIIGNGLFLVNNSGLSGKASFTIRVRSTDPYNNFIEASFTLTKTGYDVAPEKLKIINAFSPDGDGVNDEWAVPELRFYNQVLIEVFDRSGVKLFETTDPEKGWDGRGRDGKILKGAFFYVIQVKDINMVKRGVVTILNKQ